MWFNRFRPSSVLLPKTPEGRSFPEGTSYTPALRKALRLYIMLGQIVKVIFIHDSSRFSGTMVLHFIPGTVCRRTCTHTRPAVASSRGAARGVRFSPGGAYRGGASLLGAGKEARALLLSRRTLTGLCRGGRPSFLTERSPLPVGTRRGAGCRGILQIPGFPPGRESRTSFKSGSLRGGGRSWKVSLDFVSDNEVPPGTLGG